MRKITKRAAIIGTSVVLAIGGAGAAFAAWNSIGSGSATATAGSAAKLTVSAVAVDALYPGATSNVTVTVVNDNPYPLAVSSVSFGSVTAQPAGTNTCTTTGVTFTGKSGLTDVVPAHTTGYVTLTGAAKMDNTSDDGCQGASFSAPATVTASSAS